MKKLICLAAALAVATTASAVMPVPAGNNYVRDWGARLQGQWVIVMDQEVGASTALHMTLGRTYLDPIQEGLMVATSPRVPEGMVVCESTLPSGSTIYCRTLNGAPWTFDGIADGVSAFEGVLYMQEGSHAARMIKF